MTWNLHNEFLTSAMDSHLSEKDFEGVRQLTDVGRAAGALPLPVEVGTKVVFAGTLGAHLTYDKVPPEGSQGEVVNVKSANGDITHHDGKVFVKWDDGEFRPIHAEHLRLAGCEKLPEGPMRDNCEKKKEEGKEDEESSKKAKKKLPEDLKKHQFTSEDNPNPKGNDKDGDGETNEPSPLKGKKADWEAGHRAPGGWDPGEEEAKEKYPWDDCIADQIPAMMLEREVTPEGRQVMASYWPRKLRHWQDLHEVHKKDPDLAEKWALIVQSNLGGSARSFADSMQHIQDEASDAGAAPITEEVNYWRTRLAFSIRPELKKMAAKMQDILDEFGMMGAKAYKSQGKKADKEAKLLPYEINQNAMIEEAGSKLMQERDPLALAKKIVKLRSFKKMVGSSEDMVKDALLALEDGDVIRKFDDDTFFELRDETERLMGFRSANDQAALIRLAATMEKGSEERRTILKMALGSFSMDEDEYRAANKAIRKAISDIADLIEQSGEGQLESDFYDLLRKYRKMDSAFKLAGLSVDSAQYQKMMDGAAEFFEKLEELMEEHVLIGREAEEIYAIINGLSRKHRFAKEKLPEDLKKHQFTSEDNPNPKGNDKDGDGETNEPSPIKGKKAALIRLASTYPAGSKERIALLKLIAGCEKLPEGPMRDNCEKKKEEGEESKDKESKKSSLRVASLGDLTNFLKIAEGVLVHKSTNDLWSFAKDADGFVVSRLFDDTGEPLKG